MHIFIPCRKYTQFQNNRWKTARGVAPTRYLSIHFDSISYKKKKKKETKLTKQKNSENNQSFIPKPHAHLQSMRNTSAKFQNNQKETVRGVAPRRYLLSIHFDSISCKNETEKVQNYMHIFIPCRKHMQRFKTIGGKL